MTALPPVMVNSLPKSGTHLLAKAVELCGCREHFEVESALDPAVDPPGSFDFGRVTGRLRAQSDAPAPPGPEAIPIGTQTPIHVSRARMRYWLEAIPPGRYIMAHIARSEALSSLLAELGMVHLFIIRDPRAVLDSLLEFVLNTGEYGEHFLARDFREMAFSDRVGLLLEGGYAPVRGVRVRPFRDIYRQMLDWQGDPRCLVVRFEALIGPDGGGDAELQRRTMRRIAEHVGVEPDAALTAASRAVYDPGARTFRRGRIDGWADSMPADDVARLEAYCRPLLRDGGYLG